MVLFTPEDWLIGISTLSILIFGYGLGLFFLYTSRKFKIKLLTYYSLAVIAATTDWLPIMIDFFSVLLTGKSINKIFYVLLMWTPFAISLFFSYYIANVLLIPKWKNYVMILLSVNLLFFIFYLYIDPLGAVIFIEPPQTSFYHKAGLNPSHIASLLAIINLIIILIFGGFGYLYKGIKSKGILRKKFYFLSLGHIILVVFGLLDSFAEDYFLVLVRIGAMSSFWFGYLGLRKEPEKKEKPKREFKIEGELFRLTKRPDGITEEEVTFHREKKICLVCKGKVGGFNTYICTNCNVLYCENCARTLAKLENMCWVCDTSIDPSRPVRPYKKEEEEEIEVSKEALENSEPRDIPS